MASTTARPFVAVIFERGVGRKGRGPEKRWRGRRSRVARESPRRGDAIVSITILDCGNAADMTHPC